MLDCFAMMTILADEPGSTTVTNLLIGAAAGKIFLLMNEVNIGELLYAAKKKGLREDLDEFLEDLRELPIEWIPVDISLVVAAARIKSTRTLSYADCFAVATAMREDALVVTGDPEFRNVEDLVDIEWL